MSARLAVSFVMAGLWVGICSAEAPPGIPDMTFPEDELFTFISHMPVKRDASTGWEVTPVENPEFPLLLNGYVVIPGRQHTSIFDFSDPYDPKLLNKVEMYEDHKHMPELNGWGLTTGYGGVHLAHADTNSMAFWDFTDHMNAKKVSEVTLPHPINPGNCPGGWKPGWGFPLAHAWQAPYFYSSMNEIGIDIVDVHDIENPIHVKRIWTCTYPDRGWLAVGVVNIVGNLLIHSPHIYSRHVQILDISDPENPVEIGFAEDKDKMKSLYCGFVNGNRYFASGPAIHEWDISDPTNITYVRTYNRTLDCEEECSTGGTDIQDNYIHWGGSASGYEKFDLTTGESVGTTGPLPNPEKPDGRVADLDLVTVFGNIAVVSSEDGYQCIGLVPHQAEPDRNPPKVNMVNPKDGAEDLATTCRVGFTFTDNIDHRSLNIQTVIVRPEGGEAINGKFSVNKSIVNFSPDACLEKNTCYEVVVPAGGVKDYAGNATAEEFTSTFCTGETENETVCQKRAEMDPTPVAPDVTDRALRRREAGIRCRAIMNCGDMSRRPAGSVYDTRGRLVRGDRINVTGVSTTAKGVYILKNTGNRSR